jgi:pimeloyl-ACP methyl ester carboxylesterase
MEERYIETNGIRLHAVEAGDGKPVILLHGFPEFWYGWRHQIGPLSEAGFKVLAPDQRGYNLSDKPDNYDLDTLADDIAGLIDTAAVVGHDWGGIVAWWLAVKYPEKVERLAILNAPHPVVFRRFLLTSPRQLLKSWYTFYFQIPCLPEAMFRWRNWHLLVESMRKTSRPGTFTDFDPYREAWSQPGAMTAMINWYRAKLPKSTDSRVHAPTLVIWGTQDTALDRRLAKASLKHCDRGRVDFIEEATHWVQHEEPERVNRLLIDFLRESAG